MKTSLVLAAAALMASAVACDHNSRGADTTTNSGTPGVSGESNTTGAGGAGSSGGGGGGGH